MESKQPPDDKWKKKDSDQEPESFMDMFRHGKFRFSIWYFIAALVLLTLVNELVMNRAVNQQQIISFSQFKTLVEDGTIRRVQLTHDYYLGFTQSTSQNTGFGGVTDVYRTVPVNDPSFIPLLDEKGIVYEAIVKKEPVMLNLLLSWVLPLGIMFIFWRFMFKRIGNMGENAMTFGRNRSKIVAEGETGVDFTDVAGADEAKAELEEVVDFLKNPDKYLSIGGKIPKGVLLVGVPGTGKTLLARAVAGVAHVPFFRMSGADFVEMFVGVGAARVRDLFKQAREKAPCIIFIDELDAIGKSRANAISSNDEREQTLNQLLVEMDGFDATSGVIILAATNRPEILDPALLRPGRFDRQVLVDKPDAAGREAILRIHSKNVKLGDDIDLTQVAKMTPGMVGADLANIVNEAALLAVRNGRKKVAHSDFSDAIEKVIAGLEKKNKLINPKERKVIAYHETGHALIAALTEGADPVTKISIVPRGLGALGYTLQMPEEDRYLMTEDELLGRIDVLLGGRAAEDFIFKKISTGASNDLTRATDIVRNMITEYGMSERFKNVALTKRGNQFLNPMENPYMQKEYSEATQQYIDDEIARVIASRYERVLQILEEHQEKLKEIAGVLLEKEVLEQKEFLALLGK
ncbi:MAG: ATP-dependent zinc metalloprotease FtsH [Spirochaetales bacterium]|nr:ATP-dependent zinc metalloprotease FtsH [Spirochaetales bacterium]